MRQLTTTEGTDKTMKRLMMVLVTTVLAVGGFALTAETASAQVSLPKGFSIWTREYCEDGSFVSMTRLHGPNGTTQGRRYVYKRNGRLCGFTVDHLTGAHQTTIYAKTTGPIASDTGMYDEYAGAIAAPAGACASFEGKLAVRHGSATWGYYSDWNRYC